MVAKNCQFFVSKVMNGVYSYLKIKSHIFHVKCLFCSWIHRSTNRKYIITIHSQIEGLEERSRHELFGKEIPEGAVPISRAIPI